MGCRSLCIRFLRFLRIRRRGKEELPPMDEVPQTPKSILDPVSDAAYPRHLQVCLPERFPQPSVGPSYRSLRMDIYRKFITVDPHPSPYFVVHPCGLSCPLDHREPSFQDPKRRCQPPPTVFFLTYPPLREKNPLIYSTPFAHLPCVPRPPVLSFRLRYLVLS